MSCLLSGNQAIALAFFDSNGFFASGYPGTPSTEIMEEISKYSNIYAEWAPNEKVALESCIGSSYAGARSIAVMKHVGLNVAADPIFTLAYTGCNAGLIIVTADDPGLHSSQNEQDNRWYANSAKIPMLEPSNSQECYDFVNLAFKISEFFITPVFIRLTTRIAHSKSLVYRKYTRVNNLELKPIIKERRFDPIPSVSKELHLLLEEKLSRISNFSDTLKENSIEYADDKSLGIITSGITYQYTKEVFGNSVSILKLGLIYPLPKKTINNFSKQVNKLYVIEELDGFLEMQLKNIGINCTGKEIFPRLYELSPNIIKDSFNMLGKKETAYEQHQNILTFCSGCPYRAFFYELAKYKENVIISSDIGCYSLSGNEPFKAKDIAICMGAGFSIAHGIQKIFQLTDNYKKCIGIMGGSTFFHSGITSLLTSVYNQSNAFFVILDNSSTSMTGLQDNPGTKFTLNKSISPKINIESIVKALGVKNIKVLDSILLSDIHDALDWGLSFNDTSVLIFRVPCTLKAKKSLTDKAKSNFIDTNLCTNCKGCLKISCPSIKNDISSNMVSIDINTCTGCNLCTQLCKNNAIKKVSNHE